MAFLGSPEECVNRVLTVMGQLPVNLCSRSYQVRNTREIFIVFLHIQPDLNEPECIRMICFGILGMG